MADSEHERSRRQYAHVFHLPATVCVSRAIVELPPNYKLGILAHEVGHLIAGPEASEEEADRAASDAGGFEILRVDSPWGGNLQYVASHELGVCLSWLFSFFGNAMARLL